MGKISSEKDLQGEEIRIGWHLSQLRLDAVLLGIRVYGERVHQFEFVRAGLAAFAVRYCQMPDHRARDAAPLTTLKRLAHRVALYLLADPITFDEKLREEFNSSNPVFLLLRIQASQHPFYAIPYGAHVRALVLYDELPRSLVLPAGVPDFAFYERFCETTNGVEIADFIRIGIVAFAAAAAHSGFTIEYFRRARAVGVAVPEDEIIVRVLQQITADPIQFREQYQRLLTPDRRFAMYDFNPLLSRPIIRPWTTDAWTGSGSPRMTAPVPELVPARLSNGIYHQLFEHFGTAFSEYFGYLFEAYCGRVLVESRSGQELLSEQEIRARCPSWNGKVPDWFWVDGTAAIAFECKATRFTRAALATGAESAVADSLRQVRKGLVQLAEFRTGCASGADSLEPFAGLTILPVLVTAETMYGINSGFFREYLDAQLAEVGVPEVPWRIISITELEVLQPHVAAGLRLDEEIARRAGRLDGEAVTELERQTGRSVEDSFLHSYHEEMLDSLGRASKPK